MRSPRPYRFVVRAACFALAIHFFNFSMDSRDRAPDFIPEDPSINDIESISEFVAEVVFGADNAFAEHDEQDGDISDAFNVLKTFICHTSFGVAPRTRSSHPSQKHMVRNVQYPAEHVEEIQSPPPQRFSIS